MALPNLQKIFTDAGVKPPKFRLRIYDATKRDDVSIDLNPSDPQIPRDQAYWATTALQDTAAEIQNLLKLNPALLANFIKDKGEIWLGGENSKLHASAYLSRYRDECENFAVFLKTGKGNLPHELGHHVDCPGDWGQFRHSRSDLYDFCAKYDRFFHPDGASNTILELLKKRGYEQYEHGEHFAVFIEQFLGSQDHKPSSLLEAYKTLVELDLEYQLSRPDFVLDRGVDVISRYANVPLHQILSPETSDAISEFLETKMKIMNPDTDRNSVSIFQERADRLQCTIEEQAAVSIRKYVAEIREAVGLPSLAAASSEKRKTGWGIAQS